MEITGRSYCSLSGKRTTAFLFDSRAPAKTMKPPKKSVKMPRQSPPAATRRHHVCVR
ncbi:hypothetical protein MPTK1_3g06980 [Marchantia polymorpha subsp. ruderalis]|uniref:Uncharacterized protein n=2 Tax=Marchantia polymorpha TaxID=3197 RepID=A0AAF6AY66_MARPO|nr:hypothetical protein MARPO_0006s0171 [Marchantia polymorpha]BBN04700.1 hypothetical protein Mp_3g06980 [Marchantia polymorpha subsp. ruderalis]|eukprot:PTQ48144.1 hypothetical protein MARPO_0006s0171 [Marchantia polymorpha]